MRVIVARNVGVAYYQGLALIKSDGVQRDSRNGPVLQLPYPLATVYERPTERVLFYDERDANPFLHLFESLWMLAGRNDLAFLTRFTRNFEAFSDDGETLHGAYGFRWRHWFNYNQLEYIVRDLRSNHDNRRQVLVMFDPENDRPDYHVPGITVGKDIPCNTHAYVQINPATGALDLTVCNRSNDIVWGAYGANAVHFSVLQEYLAAAIGVPVGTYTQFSANTHLYLDRHAKLLDSIPGNPIGTLADCPYRTGLSFVFPLVQYTSTFLESIEAFLERPESEFSEAFIAEVASPMWRAWRSFKTAPETECVGRAVDELARMPMQVDWRRAATEWLLRRLHA